MSNPLENEIAFLQNHADAIVIPEHPRVIQENFYYQLKLDGTSQKMFARNSLWLRLQEVLCNLPEHLGLILFDTYRSIETQAALFSFFEQKISQDNPHLDAKSVFERAKTFVSHPDKLSNFTHPHNTGGAVDLGIWNFDQNTMLDFGTDFDEASQMAQTDFFTRPFDAAYSIDKNRWETIEKNRKLLYSNMTQKGFANYAIEWWHFGLGSKHWSLQNSIDWSYTSMEDQVHSLIKN